MSSQLPMSSSPKRTSKSSYGVSDAMRRYRILPSDQCQDNRAKLANLKRLISATEQEYRSTMASLDRLDREGQAWLMVDLIHKTSLVTLDLGASLMELAGLKSGEGARKLADGVRSGSDIYNGVVDFVRGQSRWDEFGRTVLSAGARHTKANGPGGAYAKGSADLGLAGWEGISNVSKADPESAGRRAAEAGVDGLAGIVQRVAEIADADPKNQSRKPKQVSALAQIARSMASYNRELEGAFNRRLEIAGGLNASRATFKAAMERTMARYRSDVAEIERLVQSCM